MSIYHGWSIQKTFGEGKFTGEETFTLGEFKAFNMKNYGCRNVRKHIEIKDSASYIILYTSLKFGSLKKMRITSSNTKYNLG